MPDLPYDVLGVGNAIVDIISRCDDAFLAAHHAPKGHMRLVDRDTADALYDAMGPATEISGGSAANTIAGIASLGGRAAFIGKVADDQFGRIFRHDLEALGVKFAATPDMTGRESTAKSLILVTPDGQRTMNTFLGISPYLDSQDLNAYLIESSAIVYLEGYLFDREEAKAAFNFAAETAKKAGRKVALTLSDGFCVDRHRDSFHGLIKNGIDILFANENELLSLYQTDDYEAAFSRCAETVPMLAATRSEKGSRLKSGSTIVNVAASPVAAVVDSTGAGDLYAAGILFGLSRGMELEDCGRLGSLAAAEIISHVGPRPATSLKELATKNGFRF